VLLESPLVLKLLRVVRCGTQLLVQVKDSEELTGIDPNKIYDFEDARFENVVAMTKKDDLRTRGRVTKKQVRQLLELYGAACTYCFRDLANQEYHVDHIVPISFGGSSQISNLAISCPPCNLKKGKLLFSTLAAIRNFCRGGR
jgi:hypothetical protein